jgi:predicted MFS family arabinose efflux permease
MVWSRPLRRLWLGRIIVELTDQVVTIALLWFVLELTGSGAATGLVVLCSRLPAVITAPFVGRLLDRCRPRLVMGADNLVRALLLAAVPVLHWQGRLSMAALLGLAVLGGAIAPATDVGSQAVLPRLVHEPALEQANAWLSASEQLGYLIGPAAAGFLVAAVGGPTVLLGAALALLATAAVLWSLPDHPATAAPDRPAGPAGPAGPPQPAAAPARAGGDWLGFRPLLGEPGIRGVTLVTLGFFLAYGPLEPALPFYSRDSLAAGPAGYGLLWSAFGAGAVAGLLPIRLVARARAGLVAAAIPALWGLLLAPLAVVGDLPVAMLFLGLAAFVWAPYEAVVLALVQRRVPPDRRGRALGARRAVTAAATPLGAAAGGLLLGPLDPPAVIGLSALACVLVGAVALLSPAVRAAGGTARHPAPTLSAEPGTACP